MLLSDQRSDLRRGFVDAWRKQRAGEPLTALEAQIAAVVADHGEYHALLETGDEALDKDFHPDDGVANPFLHMALHLAVRDQIATDRPPGIRAAYTRARAATSGRHAAEHTLLDCLAEALWRAQRDGQPPDERAYLAAVQQRLAR